MRAGFLLLFSLFLSSCAIQAREPVLEELNISTSNGDNVTYLVELARTPSQMRRGLMFRDSLPGNQGMLFVHEPERQAAMWMRNTILSLDMIFIDRNGEIVFIEENTEPFSLETISAGVPVRAVLELNAGQVQKHQITVGDRVLHPVFK